MAAPRESLKQHLRHIASISPWGLSDAELDAVIREILRIWGSRTPTRADWLEAARKHVSGAGSYKYAGEDMADLNALLLQIQNAKPSGPSGAVKK
jgi:hypothetical protein